MSITINGCRPEKHLFGRMVEITTRKKTVLLTAHQWAGHQCSAYEGAIAQVRIVRPTIREAVAELQRRWESLAAEKSKYVSFGGKFRHAPYDTVAEVQETIDAIEEAVEEIMGEGAATEVAAR